MRIKEFFGNIWIQLSIVFSVFIICDAVISYINEIELAEKNAATIRYQVDVESAAREMTDRTEIYLACLKHRGTDCKNPYEEDDEKNRAK